MTNYSVGDFLIRVKNAALAENKEVVVPMTKISLSAAKVLKKLGYLSEVGSSDSKKEIVCSLAFKRKKPVLMGLKLISKPGLRIYMGVSEIENRKKPVLL